MIVVIEGPNDNRQRRRTLNAGTGTNLTYEASLIGIQAKRATKSQIACRLFAQEGFAVSRDMNVQAAKPSSVVCQATGELFHMHLVGDLS